MRGVGADKRDDGGTAYGWSGAEFCRRGAGRGGRIANPDLVIPNRAFPAAEDP